MLQTEMSRRDSFKDGDVEYRAEPLYWFLETAFVLKREKCIMVNSSIY